MYTTMDYKEAGAIYGLILLAILYILYAVAQPWADLYLYSSQYVAAQISGMRILVYGLPIIPVLISLLPMLYILARFERKYFFLAFLGAHILDQIFTGHNYILTVGYMLIQSLLTWLFGSIWNII